MSELEIPSNFAQSDPDPDDAGNVVVEVDFGQSLDQRLSKLLQAGILDPFKILKIRLDVVTQYAVPKGAWDDMEASYLETLEAVVAHGEEFLVRSQLMQGVQGAPLNLRGDGA
jgi:hypothetical protein